MHVLSLHQPWATLIAIGAKTIETRSRSAPQGVIGQRIAIHATAEPPADGLVVGPWAAHPSKGYGAWMEAPPRSGGDRRVQMLPLGAIVATAVLCRSLPIIHGPLSNGWPHVQVNGDWLWVVLADSTVAANDQRPYGDYGPNRWAYLLEGVEPVDPALPFKGGQGWSKSWTP